MAGIISLPFWLLLKAVFPSVFVVPVLRLHLFSLLGQVLGGYQWAVVLLGKAGCLQSLLEMKTGEMRL